MAIFDLLAVLLVLAATFGWVNDRYVRLPLTVGIMAIGLAVSLGLIALSLVYPALKVDAERLLAAIDLDQLLLHGALGFLLFAGALHIEFGDLREHRVSIGVLAVVGTLLSTGIVGGLCWLFNRWLELGLTPSQCLLFGALISPTDPIAVLGMLKSLGAPRHLEVQIAGESLFNDCVGVVVFLALLQFGGRPMPAEGDLALDLLVLAAREVLGGAALGLLLGLLAYLMLKRIDNYQVEILISLALVTGGYAWAERLHLSAAITAVTAGLLVGNQGRAFAMSDRTRQHLDTFWELVDEILNALLFVLLGLEVLALPLRREYVVAGVLAVPAVLLARFVATGLSMQLVRVVTSPALPHAVKLLTWGGLRGGLPVALALVLRDHLPARQADLLLVMTYFVVVFSILVQGLSMKPLVRLYVSAARSC
ncbi:MAG TPA: sodium:proton antiporter [Methylomirabilota bacterium]|jgi:CPA1 family monovalent cation:H+ antiporter